MQKINTAKIVMFTVLVLGTLVVASMGFQTNAFAAHSGVLYDEEGFIESAPSIVRDNVVASNVDVCPYPSCM